MSKPKLDPKQFVKQQINKSVKKSDIVEMSDAYLDTMPVVIEAPTPPTSIRISLGELQIDILKSMKGQKDSQFSKKTLTKALKIFKSSSAGYLSLKDEKAATEEIMKNWDLHGERFSQILFAVEQVRKGKSK